MLIYNPLTTELSIPLAITFSGLLSFGLIAVIFASLKSKDAALNKQLFLRWMSWALIAPITVASILAGPLVFAILASIISLVCTNEFCAITNRSNAERIVLAVASVMLPLIACSAIFLLAPTIVVVALLLAFFSMKSAQNFQATCISLVALFYVPLLSTHAVLLEKIETIGPALLISIISSSALANIFAFVFGKLIGGPKLAAGISPNKTWSGAVGSIVGAFVGFSILAATTSLTLPAILTFSIPMVVAVAGIIGDLFESQLKRSFEVKDAGNWLPGFGGALDRVDGLLFILPCVYYLVAPLVRG